LFLVVYSEKSRESYDRSKKFLQNSEENNFYGFCWISLDFSGFFWILDKILYFTVNSTEKRHKTTKLLKIKNSDFFIYSIFIFIVKIISRGIKNKILRIFKSDFKSVFSGLFS